ncbi:MAG: DsbA family protein [Rhodospirillales bacterium]|nr:DsbA family protein [Rhodospirillales bacterium]
MAFTQDARPSMRTRLVLAVPALALLLAAQAWTPAGASDHALSPAQKKQVEEVIRQYLLKNPEVMGEAINSLRAREETEEAQSTQEIIAKRQADIERDPAAPVAGNPKGDVTLVEFFDYRCGFCKRVHETVQAVIKKDGNVRFVYKEFPVLGPESMFAAHVALAAFKLAPGKYPALHEKIMALPSRSIDEENVMAQVGAVGLDPKAVRQKMQDPAILKEIERTQELAEALRIRGTPSFIVGDILIPGATDEDTLEKAIAAARAKKKS